MEMRDPTFNCGLQCYVFPHVFNVSKRPAVQRDAHPTWSDRATGHVGLGKIRRGAERDPKHAAKSGLALGECSVDVSSAEDPMRQLESFLKAQLSNMTLEMGKQLQGKFEKFTEKHLEHASRAQQATSEDEAKSVKELMQGQDGKI